MNTLTQSYSTPPHRLELMYEVLWTIKSEDTTQETAQINMFRSRRLKHIVKQYLPELVAKNFATISSDNRGGHRYSLTKEGMAYLDNYGLIINFATSFGVV